MNTIDNLNSDRGIYILGYSGMNRQIVAMSFISAKRRGIVGDVFQRTCDSLVTDGNVALKIRSRLAPEILACRDIGINRQA